MSTSPTPASPSPQPGRLLPLAWEFARPFTLLAPFVGFLSSGLAALGTRKETAGDWAVLAPLLFGSVMSATLNAASNTLNQVHDREVDAVNKPHRPIPSGRATIRQANIITVFYYVVALVLAWFCQPPAGVPGHGERACFWIVLVAAFLTWAYSAPPIRSKRMGWGANLTIAIPRGVLLKVAGWSSVLTVLDPEPWYIGLIFGLFLIGATNTKDFADMEGDRAGGCRTLPVVLGLEKAVRVTVPFFVVPFLLIPLGASMGWLTGNRMVLVILGFTMASYGAWIARGMLKDPGSLAVDDNHPSWAHMYAMMILGQLGFALAYWL
ncbi:MAG: UbiA family prenyltransferase [Acidobacteriota bacterium]